MVEIIGHGTILIVHTAAIMIVYTNKFAYIYHATMSTSFVNLL